MTGFAQAGSTPLLVKGTVDVPYVEEVGLYRSIDGFWECVATAKLMDGKYVFALDAPQTEPVSYTHLTLPTICSV